MIKRITYPAAMLSLAVFIMTFSCAGSPPSTPAPYIKAVTPSALPARPAPEPAHSPAPSDLEIIGGTSYRLYQFFISSQDGAVCVFYPTCSQYMMQSLHSGGPAGFLAGIDRIMRCHPAQLENPLYERTADGRLIDMPGAKK